LLHCAAGFVSATFKISPESASLHTILKDPNGRLAGIVVFRVLIPFAFAVCVVVRVGIGFTHPDGLFPLHTSKRTLSVFDV